MSSYDFDTRFERRGTDSLKYDKAVSRHRSPDLLSLWVADMDFRTPECVIDAIVHRAEHGVFGYTDPGEGYYQAVCSWMEDHHGWKVDASHISIAPTVVFALAQTVLAFTRPGDSVLIQQPVYYPFRQVVVENERVLVNAPLKLDDTTYAVDFDAFEAAIVENNVKLFLLCNPHNPVGRVWTKAELMQMASICLRHNVVIVSDEIHMDFARPGFAHTSMANLGTDIAENTIVLTSASKTFNLAGLQIANVITHTSEMRSTVRKQISAAGYSQANTLGVVATQTAYERGFLWLVHLKEYLEGNWALLGEYLDTQLPELRLIPAQSTYLAWVDCRTLGLSSVALERFIEDEAGLWLDCGHIFGEEGEGFIRLNIATQKSYLRCALEQLAQAVAARRA